MSLKKLADALMETMGELVNDVNFTDLAEWCTANGMPADIDPCVSLALGALAAYFTKRGCPPATLAAYLAISMQMQEVALAQENS